MRLPVRFSLFSAVLSLGLLASASVRLQPGAAVGAEHLFATSGNGTYIAVDPLANIRYDNRYDLSLGLAYAHMKAGPTLLEGSNLGGLDLSGSYWLSKHWAAEGNLRGYAGHQRRRNRRQRFDAVDCRPVCRAVFVCWRPGVAGTAQQAWRTDRARLDGRRLRRL